MWCPLLWPYNRWWPPSVHNQTSFCNNWILGNMFLSYIWLYQTKMFKDIQPPAWSFCQWTLFQRQCYHVELVTANIPNKARFKRVLDLSTIEHCYSAKKGLRGFGIWVLLSTVTQQKRFKRVWDFSSITRNTRMLVLPQTQLAQLFFACLRQVRLRSKTHHQ